MRPSFPITSSNQTGVIGRRSTPSFSKADTILRLQQAGYFVVLLFVGLANADLSILRVATRRQQGGHDVPQDKLEQRFPRTQLAIRDASPIADMTLMFDNSRTLDLAFTLVRAQVKAEVLYDCRRRRPVADQGLIGVASAWLDIVAPLRGVYVRNPQQPTNGLSYAGGISEGCSTTWTQGTPNRYPTVELGMHSRA